MINSLLVIFALTLANTDVSLEKKEVFLGEKNRLTCNITLKDYEILDADIVQKDIFVFDKKLKAGKMIVDFAAYKLGEVNLPLKIYYRSSKNDSGDLMVKNLKLEVKAKLKNPALLEIVGNKEIMTSPVTDSRMLMALYSSMALLLILIPVNIFYKKRKSPASEEDTAPKIDAEKLAAGLMENIKEKAYIDNSDYKGYYDAISDVIRKYIQAKYNVPALEMTMNELEQNLSARNDILKKNEILDLLREADEIKFSPDSQLPAGLDTIWKRTYSLILEDDIQ